MDNQNEEDHYSLRNANHSRLLFFLLIIRFSDVYLELAVNVENLSGDLFVNDRLFKLGSIIIILKVHERRNFIRSMLLVIVHFENTRMKIRYIGN